MKEQEKILLDEPKQAVDSYLAALLSEVDEYQQPEPTVAEVISLHPAVTEVTAEPVAETQLFEEVAVEVVTEVAESADTPSQSEIIPDWAQEPFQCLLFRVRGMTLAVPLMELLSIAEWTERPTTIPGQPDWHQGVLVHREEQVVVVDTAQLIMPERLGRADAEQIGSRHILIVGDGRWGLACDSIQRPVSLEADQVKWRIGARDRPWMIGTVVDKLCALLDVGVLVRMLGHE